MWWIFWILLKTLSDALMSLILCCSCGLRAQRNGAFTGPAVSITRTVQLVNVVLFIFPLIFSHLYFIINELGAIFAQAYRLDK